jgi:hypothetical protein
MNSNPEAVNPVKLFFQARHAFRIPQRLLLGGMTRRGVPSGDIVTTVLLALFLGAPAIVQMPSVVAGLVPLVSTGCIYLETITNRGLRGALNFCLCVFHRW